LVQKTAGSKPVVLTGIYSYIPVLILFIKRIKTIKLCYGLLKNTNLTPEEFKKTLIRLMFW